MDFPIKINTIRMGLSMEYFKGSQVQISKLYYFFFIIIFLSKKTVQTLMKCCILRHFIRVLAVCESPHLGVSSAQNNWKSNFFQDQWSNSEIFKSSELLHLT